MPLFAALKIVTVMTKDPLLLDGKHELMAHPDIFYMYILEHKPICFYGNYQSDFALSILESA